LPRARGLLLPDDRRGRGVAARMGSANMALLHLLGLDLLPARGLGLARGHDDGLDPLRRGPAGAADLRASVLSARERNRRRAAAAPRSGESLAVGTTRAARARGTAHRGRRGARNTPRSAPSLDPEGPRRAAGRGPLRDGGPCGPGARDDAGIDLPPPLSPAVGALGL